MQKEHLKDKSLLITGGTGSLGRALTSFLLTKSNNLKRLVIFSRDEQKQFLMSKQYPIDKYPNIRFFIGDVRDQDRLNRAFKDIDIVIHAAAMKHVPIAEYNPDECVKTNVGGAQNVINAALENNVEKVIALSTDKACAPINLYGATKLTSDKLFIAANNIKGKSNIKFSVVRYGNVMGSKGSVIPFFIEQNKTGKLPITDINMTRFNISIEEGVNLILFAIKHSLGGEIFIPKIPSYKILDVVKAINPECDIEIVGIRPGEKIHEEMITESDSYNTYDLGSYYSILPLNNSSKFDFKKFKQIHNPKRVEKGFNYSSNMNTDWESIESLKKKIKNIRYY